MEGDIHSTAEAGGHPDSQVVHSCRRTKESVARVEDGSAVVREVEGTAAEVGVLVLRRYGRNSRCWTCLVEVAVNGRASSLGEEGLRLNSEFKLVSSRQNMRHFGQIFRGERVEIGGVPGRIWERKNKRIGNCLETGMEETVRG